MRKLTERLTATNALKKGGYILGITEGCGQQYKSAASIFFILVIAQRYKILVDCGAYYPRHGKSIVGDINGINDNASLRLIIKKVGDVDMALKKDSKNIKILLPLN